MDKIYNCNSNDNEKIPDMVMKNLKLGFSDVHFDGLKMAALSKAIEEYHQDIICRIPFSNTIEAESLGAEVKFSRPDIQARIGKFNIESLEDIFKLGEMNLNKGSVFETLMAAKHLREEGKIVCLQVEGPFTIANQLMDSSFFYKSLVKEKEAMMHLFQIIEKGILNYIEQAVLNGVSIISYADPSGTLDLVGPRVYKNYSGKLNHNILKKAEEIPGDFLIHLCGKTSSSMEREGFAKISSVQVGQGLSYGHGILEILNKYKDIRIVGNGCIKLSHLNNVKNCVWRVNLS